MGGPPQGALSPPDPFVQPSDVLVQRWLDDYGTTGVKNHTLTVGPNDGVVVWYRELSLAERLAAHRAEEVAEAVKAAGAPPDEQYDAGMMAVAHRILWPAFGAIPHPVFAVGELYPLVVDRGHGPLPDEDHIGALPEHVATDVQTARRGAAWLLSDEGFSLMRDTAVLLAMRDGKPDPVTLDYLFRLPLARLRDLGALVEQIHLESLDTAEKQIHKIKDKKVVKAELERVRARYPNPFVTIDALEGLRTDTPTPHGETTEDEPSFADDLRARLKY